MNYEIAKKLKDAGLKIPPDNSDKYWLKLEDDPAKLCDNPEHADRCPTFTLSELIEACGDKFNALYFRPDSLEKWMAESLNQNGELTVVLSSTPEIAVADLWLKLHGK